MEIEFLGSGGAFSTPRPGCDCRVCVQARASGVPYSRTGPSVFVHGPDVLIDTPEESKEQINRSSIKRIAACFYSHWHPDHVAGLRVWEALNWDTRHWPTQHRRTDVYLPQQVASDFKSKTGYWEQLSYFERIGLVRRIVLPDHETVQLGGVSITPFRLMQDYVYAFLFEGNGKRVLIAPDELLGWQPSAELGHLDLAVIPMGVLEFDPFNGTRRIPAEHPVLKSEATYAQTLAIVRQLDARRVVLTHIEEPDGLSYDDLQRLAVRLQGEGLDVTFAYDTMRLAV